MHFLSQTRTSEMQNFERLVLRNGKIAIKNKNKFQIFIFNPICEPYVSKINLVQPEILLHSQMYNLNGNLNFTCGDLSK